MKLVYHLSIRAYAFAIRIAALWNPKAKKWIKGRRAVWDALSNWQPKEEKVYWFHCASLGEFEQGRPIIEELKNQESCTVVITFFSPSGYEIRKNYELADLVVYLPKETKHNVTRFLEIVRPTTVFFIKYEFWATYIEESKKLGAKIYSIAATFRKNQLFFKWYGGFMRKVLRNFDEIFTQDKHSSELLSTIGITTIIAGDTRYDRVLRNASNVSSIPLIEDFIGNSKVFVIGSSWREDDEVLKETLQQLSQAWKVIIAPHEIGETRILDLRQKFGKKTILYSELQAGKKDDAEHLIIDNIGMLMNIYQYADIAYVGGAFGKGLHNILEPAAFNTPVIFGANYQKFREASLFIEAGIGFSVKNSSECLQTFQHLSTVDLSEKISQFMLAHQGATSCIMSELNKKAGPQ